MSASAAAVRAAVLPMLAAAGLAADLPAALVSGLAPTEPGDIARALVERDTESVILSYKVLEGKFHHIQDFLKSNRMLPSNLPLW